MKWLASLVFLCLPAWAQFTADDFMKSCVYTNQAGAAFPYRLGMPQFPEAGRKYPLILFLHGSGECGTDNLKQIRVGVPALVRSLIKQSEPVIVLAPQCPSDSWWVKQLAMTADYAAPGQPAPSLEAALELCRHLVAERQADPDRLYITGLSLGGFGAWDAIQREPALFAAAIPICGGGDIRRVQDLKRLPIWVFHGRDDKNVPVGCGRRMVEALRQNGARVKYTEYENAAHNVWDRTYADPAVIEWLLKQSRAAKKPWWRFW
jgi:predicted peptidase